MCAATTIDDVQKKVLQALAGFDTPAGNKDLTRAGPLDWMVKK